MGSSVFLYPPDYSTPHTRWWVGLLLLRVTDDDEDVAVAEWGIIRGTADEAAPGARVHALSRVLLFPDERAVKGLPSQRQQEAIEKEGPSTPHKSTFPATLAAASNVAAVAVASVSISRPYVWLEID